MNSIADRLLTLRDAESESLGETTICQHRTSVRCDWIGRTTVVTLLLFCTSILGLNVSAASPPATPAPVVCQTHPRSFDDLRDLSATPAAATPVPRFYKTIRPAEPKIVSEIRVATERIIACFNSGDPTQAYALFTDAYLQRLLTPALVSTLGTPIAATPTAEDLTQIKSISDISYLADGRVIATIILDPADIPVLKMYQFVFVRDGETWLLDDVVDELRFSLP